MQRLGYVRNFLKLPFAPGRLALYQRFLDRLMRSDDACLPGIERELLALVVSVENRCEPCVNAHAAALRKHGMDGVKGDEITISWRRAGLPPRHRALAEFAWKLTVRPADADETWIGALRSAGPGRKADLRSRADRRHLQLQQPHQQRHRPAAGQVNRGQSPIPLLNDLRRLQHDRRRQLDPQRASGFQIDDELIDARLLDRDGRRIRPLQDLVHQRGRTLEQCGRSGPYERR